LAVRPGIISQKEGSMVVEVKYVVTDEQWAAFQEGVAAVAGTPRALYVHSHSYAHVVGDDTSVFTSKHDHGALGMRPHSHQERASVFRRYAEEIGKGVGDEAGA